MKYGKRRGSRDEGGVKKNQRALCSYVLFYFLINLFVIFIYKLLESTMRICLNLIIRLIIVKLYININIEGFFMFVIYISTFTPFYKYNGVKVLI